jgi:hypothetical protein
MATNRVADARELKIISFFHGIKRHIVGQAPGKCMKNIEKRLKNLTSGVILRLLEHVFKKMCSIEIVPLSVCPSVRLFPIFSTSLHLEST